MEYPGTLYIFLLISAAQAFYIKVRSRNEGKKWSEAKEFCEQYGMSLPVLSTEAEFNQFMAVREAVRLSEGKTEDDLQPWLGLTHDGSNATTADHFTWTDGQQATYVVLRDTDMETSDFTANGTSLTCVRLYYSRMKMTQCNWIRDVFCEGSVQDLSDGLPRVYIKGNIVNKTTGLSTQFVTAISDDDLPVPVGMRSLSEPVVDTIECFQHCAQLLSCRVVAVLQDKTVCYVQS